MSIKELVSNQILHIYVCYIKPQLNYLLETLVENFNYSVV